MGEAELIPVWSAARGVVKRTGRWPAVNGFGILARPSIDLATLDFCRESSEVSGAEEEWSAVGERILRDLQEAQEQAWQPAPLEERLPYQLRHTTARCGVSPPARVGLGAFRYLRSRLGA